MLARPLRAPPGGTRMFSRIRPRLSFANVTSVLALFFAVGGTSAYAVNEWTGANVQDETLTGADVRGTDGTSTTAAVNGSLTGADIAGQQAIPSLGQPFKTGSLTTWDVKDNTLTGDDILESSLAKVPNADKLDGIDSADLVHGRGTLLSNRLVLTPVNDIRELLAVPGLGTLTAYCSDDRGTLYWTNNTGSNVDV